MGVRIVRPERKIYHIPGLGIETREVLASGAAGWWEVAGRTCVAAYQPKGAASYAASLVNLANPGTYDATEGVAPTWDAATGWTFNGTQYLKTGIIPEYSQDQAALCRFAGLTEQDHYLCGMYQLNGRMFGLFVEFANNRVQYINGYGMPKAPFLSSGVLAVSGNRGYRNGIDEGVTIYGWSAEPTRESFIGARNTNGSPLLFMSGSMSALAIYSDTLSAAEVAIVSAAMATL